MVYKEQGGLLEEMTSKLCLKKNKSEFSRQGGFPGEFRCTEGNREQLK